MEFLVLHWASEGHYTQNKKKHSIKKSSILFLLSVQKNPLIVLCLLYKITRVLYLFWLSHFHMEAIIIILFGYWCVPSDDEMTSEIFQNMQFFHVTIEKQYNYTIYSFCFCPFDCVFFFSFLALNNFICNFYSK